MNSESYNLGIKSCEAQKDYEKYYLYIFHNVDVYFIRFRCHKYI